MAAYAVGLRVAPVRVAVAAAVPAFAPLSLWILDIPFTGRIVCRLAHDGRIVLPGGAPLQSRHMYLLGLVLFALIVALTLRARPRSGTQAPEVKTDPERLPDAKP